MMFFNKRKHYKQQNENEIDIPDGDVNLGQKLFQRNCQGCHNLDSCTNMGPSIRDIFNRKVASKEAHGSKYSYQIRQQSFYWTKNKLFEFLGDPDKMIPGNLMVIEPIKDVYQRACIIEYLVYLKETVQQLIMSLSNKNFKKYSLFNPYLTKQPVKKKFNPFKILQQELENKQQHQQDNSKQYSQQLQNDFFEETLKTQSKQPVPKSYSRTLQQIFNLEKKHQKELLLDSRSFTNFKGNKVLLKKIDQKNQYEKYYKTQYNKNFFFPQVKKSQNIFDNEIVEKFVPPQQISLNFRLSQNFNYIHHRKECLNKLKNYYGRV